MGKMQAQAIEEATRVGWKLEDLACGKALTLESTEHVLGTPVRHCSVLTWNYGEWECFSCMNAPLPMGRSSGSATADDWREAAKRAIEKATLGLGRE